MNDPVRNIRKIISGNYGSDSDETEPLLSSSSTSSSSFGSIMKPIEIDSESDIEQGTTNNGFNGGVSPLTVGKKCERQLIFGTPVLDVYRNSQLLVFDEEQSKFPLYMRTERMNIQTNANLLKVSTTSDEVIFNRYMDYKEPVKNTHNSLVTIFAIWNTTMGSSLLAMSWGIQMAGLFPGIALNILVASLCLYTCHLLLTVSEKHGMPGLDIEVSHLCRDLLGKWAEILAKIFSIIVLLGSDIVYLILMSNFLYSSVYFIYGLITHPVDLAIGNETVLCPNELISNSTFNTTGQLLFEQLWNLNSTVPVIFAVIMFCVLNFKSSTFFTKFNSLGTISVLYLIVFVAVKAYSWGINITDWWEEIYIKPTFSALSGMLSLSYFIHNIIISIMRNNKSPENNGRDLSIAFGLVTFTYLFIGVVFYVSFPLSKSCIEDNIFNNFSKRDTLTIIARILLMFQLFTVFPLISFMLRKDILRNINQIFKNYRFGDFTYKRVMFLNGLLLIICVLFACFLPKIGTLIRYTGALSGMVYIFLLPNMLQIASLKKENQLTPFRTGWHVLIIVAGTANLLSQFFIHD